MALVILEEELELELSVTGAFCDAGSLELFKRLFHEAVWNRSLETEGIPLGLVLYVDFLQVFIHLGVELLGLLLGGVLVGEFIIEAVSEEVQVGEADEEAGLETGALLGLVNGLDELPFVELLASDRDDAVDLLTAAR